MARYLEVHERVVTAELNGAGQVDGPHMIRVSEEHPARIGWGYVDGQFSPPAVDTAPSDVDLRLEAIADRRWRCMTAPMFHGGELIGLLDSDTLPRLDAQIATMGLLGESTLWEIRRGVFIEMDTADCRSLRYALAARIRAAYQRAAVLSGEVLSGGDPDIEAGWPA